MQIGTIARGTGSVALLLALWSVQSLASAQVPGAATGNTWASRRTSAQQQAAETSYAFEDDLVQGDTLGPNVEVLQARRRGTRDSLIRAREHFITELLKSVEDL